MSSATRVIQINAVALDLNPRWVLDNGVEDFNIIKFTLAHPRIRTPEVIALRQVPVGDPLDAYLQGHIDGLIFKEDVQGDFYLIVEALAVDNRSALGKFLAKAFNSAATAGLGLATGGISSAVLSALAGTAGEALITRITEDKPDTTTLGRAVHRFATSQLTNAVEHSLDLYPPKDITADTYDAPRARGPRGRHQANPSPAPRVLVPTTQQTGNMRIKVTPL